MYERILVATGGSPWSDAAVAYAIAIAERTGGTLYILTVLTNPAVYATPDVMGGSEVVADIMERDGRELLRRAAAQAERSGVPCVTECRWGGVPEIILLTANEVMCDLIVMGAHMVTGWKRLRLGRITNAVASKSKQPVLVVKQPPAVTPGSPLGRRILVATGGSPWSDAAVDYAIALAQREHFSLCLLHVVPKKRRQRRAMDDLDGEHILLRSQTRAADAGVNATTVLAHGDIARTIVDMAAKHACDGILLGSRGTTGWKRLMIGSISNAVIVTTTLPVLVVKSFLDDLGG
jgi:nucleotide-binding universal stress UspA family protein